MSPPLPPIIAQPDEVISVPSAAASCSRGKERKKNSASGDANDSNRRDAAAFRSALKDVGFFSLLDDYYDGDEE